MLDLTIVTLCVSIVNMIRSFEDRETESIWNGRLSRKLPIDIQEPARRKLRMINNAHVIDDLRIPPGNRLESLKGNLSGFYSIRINSQWRIVFHWMNGEADDVRVCDYH